jgi:hypothetical protein
MRLHFFFNVVHDTIDVHYVHERYAPRETTREHGGDQTFHQDIKPKQPYSVKNHQHVTY